ncbi:MAG: hypothetical protein WC998_09620, partial [Candidatus Paceibacterota bacterium]
MFDPSGNVKWEGKLPATADELFQLIPVPKEKKIDSKNHNEKRLGSPKKIRNLSILSQRSDGLRGLPASFALWRYAEECPALAGGVDDSGSCGLACNDQGASGQDACIVDT